MTDLELNFSKLVCFKCSSVLLDEAYDIIIDSHSEKMNSFSLARREGDCESSATVWFLKDDYVPDWIKQLIEESGWTKGRLNCPTCQCRIGGFDFVGGDRCSCSESQILPSVHVTKSKVDLKVATLV